MAKAKSTDGPPADAVALYERLLATAPGAERKGATVPFTALNGHMFSYLSKTGIVCLRLPPREREAFLAKYQARLCQQYGIVQREYVEVPPALLKKTAELKSYFAASLAFVKTMKPKGGKK
jgi:hypothetical protein